MAIIFTSPIMRCMAKVLIEKEPTLVLLAITTIKVFYHA